MQGQQAHGAGDRDTQSGMSAIGVSISVRMSGSPSSVKLSPVPTATTKSPKLKTWNAR